MTKKLEEMLNLPDNKDIVKKDKPKKTQVVDTEETFRDINELDKISSALPAVKGLGQMADDELNDVADKAIPARFYP